MNKKEMLKVLQDLSSLQTHVEECYSKIDFTSYLNSKLYKKCYFNALNKLEESFRWMKNSVKICNQNKNKLFNEISDEIMEKIKSIIVDRKAYEMIGDKSYEQFFSFICSTIDLDIFLNFDKNNNDFVFIGHSLDSIKIYCELFNFTQKGEENEANNY